MNVRDKLKKKAGPSARYNKYGAWLAEPENKEANELFHAWLEMGAAGETDWSGAKIHRELKALGFPCTQYTNFSAWMKNAYVVEYEAALIGANKARS